MYHSHPSNPFDPSASSSSKLLHTSTHCKQICLLRECRFHSVGTFITSCVLTKMKRSYQVLLNTINLGRRVISVLTPWADHLSISAHQSQRQFAIELASHLAFLQPLTPRQGCSQLLNLTLSHMTSGNTFRYNHAVSVGTHSNLVIRTDNICISMPPPINMCSCRLSLLLSGDNKC